MPKPARLQLSKVTSPAVTSRTHLLKVRSVSKPAGCSPEALFTPTEIWQQVLSKTVALLILQQRGRPCQYLSLSELHDDFMLAEPGELSHMHAVFVRAGAVYSWLSQTGVDCPGSPAWGAC